MWIWEHFKYIHRVASAATHILLLYRVTINTTLAGLPSGFAFGLLIKFYASVLQQELIWARAMFALCIKHKSRHACADSACWSSLSVVSLRDCGWQCLKYFSQVCKVSFIFWKKFKSYCRGKRRKVHLSFFFSLLHFWLFIYEGQPGCVTATCAAYAACTNTLVPNRKFLRWNSIAVIQGSLQTAWSDLKSFWAAEILHVNFDLPIWPSLDDFPCTVKRWANITQVVLFSIRHLSFCNHLNTGICPNKLQMLYSSKQKLF